MLGFTVAYDRPEEGFSFLVLGEAQLMIDQIGVGRDFFSTTEALGRGVNLQITLEDVSPALQRLKAAEYPLVLPLEETWYRMGGLEVGNRQFVVADPDGYLLRMTEDLGSRAR